MSKKKKWFDGRLPFLIGYTPIDLEKEMVLPVSKKKEFYYDKVNDEILVSDAQESKVFYYLGGALIALMIFVSVVIWDFIVFQLVFVGIGLMLMLYGYTIGRKETVLDRKNGLFSFPNWFYGKPYSIPFSETKAVWSSRGGVSGAIGMQLMVQHPGSQKGSDISMHAGGFENAWSFIVWYMDKNRPLPPGSAFDPYRQKDFERRKGEGFPPPLYKSRVPTPEATPDQQAEREQYWRDDEHYGTSDSAWY